jgi:hypothetical protein
MRLSPNAEHNPESGFWYRVCFACYSGRVGYYDSEGLTMNKTDEFMAARQVHEDRIVFHIHRLENRLKSVFQCVFNF